MAMPRILNNLYWFFRDGFANMTIGKTLWTIVIIKLFIMFCILKPIFFPNFLNSKFDTDTEKADYVRQELINRVTNN